MINLDEKFMSYALKLSKSNIGNTSPNPSVGCVIVKNGEIVSTGVTAKNGRPHAERIAIDKILDKAILQNADIYVTLEPCSHFGKTSPCVDEIIKYGFGKVVIATQDPDLRVNGNAIAKLRAAGITTICGVKELEAREINRAFFKAKTSNLPFVTVKIASSLDGKIATQTHDSKWITSQTARDFGHLLRAKNDAIIVGTNTIIKDNPSLDCRISGLEYKSPKIVVLSNRLTTSDNFKVFKNSENPAIIKHGDLTTVLKNLCQDGINSVLVEGGAKIVTQFLKEDLVDELVWIRNKKIIGNEGISAIHNTEVVLISQALDNLKRTEIKELEQDLIEIYRRA